MPKKAGKKGKGKKGGAAGGGAAKKVADAQAKVSPGHDVDSQALQGEGEREVATSSSEIGDAPAAAATPAPTTTPAETTQKPSAAPPQPAQDATKETAAETETEKTEPHDTAKGSLQEVVDRVQSARSGQLGTLEAASPNEPLSIPTDSAMRESKLEPVTSIEPGEQRASIAADDGDLTAAATASETLAAQSATLPERPRRESVTDLEPAVAESETTDPALTSRAKRPHETGIFSREDSTKPHKMPKTGESEEEESQKESKPETAPSAAEPSRTVTVDTTTVATQDTVTSPSDKAEATEQKAESPRKGSFSATQQSATTAGPVPTMKHTEAPLPASPVPVTKHTEAVFSETATPSPNTAANVLPLTSSPVAASEQPAPTVAEMISTYPEGGAATAAAIAAGASNRPVALSTQREQLQRAEDRVQAHDQAMKQMAADKETAKVPTRPVAAKLPPGQEAAQEEVAAATALDTQAATPTTQTATPPGLRAKQEQDKAAALKAQQDMERQERRKTGFFGWLRRKFRGEK